MRRNPSNDWTAMREAVPVLRKWAYLDHAAVAPLPSPTAQALQVWLTEATMEGDTVWPRWRHGLEQARRLAAEIVGARPEDIALVPNTTAGINLVAEGYPWQPGDNVVTLANEFPSNQYPWLNQARRGVEVRRVPVERGRVNIDALLEAIDGRTRIVSVSWVGYASGYRLDVERLADEVHARGAFLFLDAIQGLGVFPLDVAAGIDFLAADGHKWLLGPEGAGIFAVRPELLDLLSPVGVGWNSVQQAFDYQHIELTLRPTAARFEGGSHNMAGFLGLGASLQFLLDYGLGPRHSDIAERVVEVSELACEALAAAGASILSDRSAQHRSGIVAFEFPGIPLNEARKLCERGGVVLSVRGGHLRIAPHAYNNGDDVDQLVETLLTLRESAQSRG